MPVRPPAMKVGCTRCGYKTVYQPRSDMICLPPCPYCKQAMGMASMATLLDNLLSLSWWVKK